MSLVSRSGAGLLLGMSLFATTPAFAQDIADICPTTGDVADRADYSIFAASAFLQSEHAAPDEYLTDIIEGTLERSPPANGADVILSHPGDFARTSSQRLLHITTPGDVRGGGLIPENRIVVLRSPEVQGVIALTPCGSTYFVTWTTPSFLADFVWPDAADLD